MAAGGGGRACLVEPQKEVQVIGSSTKVVRLQSLTLGRLRPSDVRERLAASRSRFRLQET